MTRFIFWAAACSSAKAREAKVLAAAGGYGEGVEPLWAVCAFLEAGAEDGVALDADGRGRFGPKIALRLCRDDVPQRGDVRAAARGAALPSMKVSVSMKSASTRQE